MTRDEALKAVSDARNIGRRANLRSADLHGANLRSADLHGADLRSADLRSANLSGADLRRANLSGADLSGADLRSADLHGANLSGADLRRANLSGADLHGADLRSADLHGANLSGADLRSANLSGANLHGANLYNAHLPVPAMALLADWGACSDGLTLALMQYDVANHPNPKVFTAWAKGGTCPYSGVKAQRAANFYEKREIYKYGASKRPYDLMVMCLREHCKTGL